jgi:sulfatase modifying factor 1
MKAIIGFIFLIISTQVLSQKAWIEPSMILVEGGIFQMGMTGGLKKEGPAHTVALKRFYIGKYEVSQNFWQSVMGNDPATFKGCGECPVEQVSPEQIDTFLVQLKKVSGKNYRLPTEAEWEYAAMGGNKSKGYKYSGSNDLREVAWYKNNADNKTHIAGQKKPNELGIYDMSGNVWELCSDWYDADFYKKSGKTNPRNDKKARYRVLRGGSWRSGEERCYSKARNRNINDHRKSNGGLRLVLDM